MKFKMRIVYHSPSGSAESVALAIARDQKTTADKIPPAYPIENEKLLFLLVETKGSSVDKAVTSFCNDLNPGRTKNVAVMAIGGNNLSGIEELKKIITANGIGIAGDVHQCELTGFLKKKISDKDIEASVAWAAKVVDSL